MSGSTIVLIVSAIAIGLLVMRGPRLLDQYAPRLGPAAILQIELGAIAILVAALALLISLGTRASFTVSAQTELVTVRVRPSDLIKWPKPAEIYGVHRSLPKGCERASFLFDDAGAEELLITFTPYRKASKPPASAAGAELAVIRMAAEAAPSGLQVRVESAARSAGTLICDGDQRVAAPRGVRLVYPAGVNDAAPTLPIEGVFVVGGSAADSSPTEAQMPTPLLVSGALTLEARSWPFRSGRFRSETPLKLGDVLKFKGSDGKTDAPATGLIRAGNDVLSMVAYAEAASATVSRRSVDGEIDVAYAPTLWSRMQAMNEWGVLLVMGALALAGVGALRRYVEVRTLSPPSIEPDQTPSADAPQSDAVVRSPSEEKPDP